jgi:hypothetical protein
MALREAQRRCLVGPGDQALTQLEQQQLHPAGLEAGFLGQPPDERADDRALAKEQRLDRGHAARQACVEPRRGAEIVGLAHVRLVSPGKCAPSFQARLAGAVSRDLRCLGPQRQLLDQQRDLAPPLAHLLGMAGRPDRGPIQPIDV